LVANKFPDFVSVLRSKSACFRMGATLIGGLNSGASIPVQSTGSTASFIGENPGVDTPASDSSFGQIGLSPHVLQVVTSYSKQFAQQSSPDVEAFFLQDIGGAHAAAIDQAALAGTGTVNQPLGVTRHPLVPIVALGVDGLAPSGAALCSVEASIADASADLGTLGWLSTPLMRSKLRQVPVFTNSSLPCWTGIDGADQLLGSPAAVSKSVPQGLTKGANSDCHCIIAGYWPALAIANWGVLELTYDPYAQKRRNLVEVCSYQAIDIVVRRPTAFAMILDARNV